MMRQLLQRLWLAALLALIALPAMAAPAMWVVRDGDSKVWLFGSMHILPKDVVWQTDLLDLVLHEADKVYFECDLGIFSLLAVTMQVSREALAASAAPVYWTDELSDEDYDYADDTVAAYGLDLERLAILPPWLAELTVTAQAVRAARADINTEEGVDIQLLRTLPLRRKAYLELATEQIGYFASVPYDAQIAGFMDTLRALRVDAHVEAEQRELFDAWIEGRTDDLDVIVRREMAPQVREVLLYQRNRNWLAQVTQLLADNHEDLIVVGAGHLAGEDSLIDLLEKAGFTVTRIQ